MIPLCIKSFSLRDQKKGKGTYIYAGYVESAYREGLTIKSADGPKLGVGMLYHRSKVQNYHGIIEG